MSMRVFSCWSFSGRRPAEMELVPSESCRDDSIVSLRARDLAPCARVTQTA